MSVARSALRSIDRAVSWSILGGLTTLAVVAWLLTIWQAQAMGTFDERRRPDEPGDGR